MLRVVSSRAQAGMVLAMPVYRPFSSEVLLRAGFTLDGPTITRLRALRVPEVWITYPGADEIRAFISPAVMQAQATLVTRTAQLFSRVQEKTGAKLDYGTYCAAVAGVIEELLADPGAAVHIVELAGAGENLARHAAATCLLSVLLGLRLQGYLVRERPRLSAGHARSTQSLGAGAMLHDIGLSRMPEVAERVAQSRDMSDPEWRTHPRIGYEMVSGNIDSSAAIVVLDHHQSWEGEGFPDHPDPETGPRPRRGREIHVFARIAAVADTFDRLLHRPDGGTWPRVRVMREMLAGPLRRHFDPVVLSVLPVVSPPYPPGSVVTLNDGREAVVIDWDGSAPCRPTVIPFERAGAEGGGIGGGAAVGAVGEGGVSAESIDLREVPELEIVAQDGHDVAADNFEYTYGKALLEARCLAEGDRTFPEMVRRAATRSGW